jgi:hypothetical protein
MIANSDPQHRSTLTPDGSLTALVAPDRRPRPRRGLLGRSDGSSMAHFPVECRCFSRSGPARGFPQRDGARVSSAASHNVPIEWLPKVQMHDSILRMKRTALTVAGDRGLVSLVNLVNLSSVPPSAPSDWHPHVCPRLYTTSSTSLLQNPPVPSPQAPKPSGISCPCKA